MTWLRWDEGRQMLDLWCQSVGPPVLAAAPVGAGESLASAGPELERSRWRWGRGGVDLQDPGPHFRRRHRTGRAVAGDLSRGRRRAGAASPSLSVPRAIRPRRPALDITGIANRFGLSVAYVPSMRNGPATGLGEREDRGNAVLSTEPMSDIRAIELPFGKQRRVAVAATVTPRRSTPIRVVVTHFDTNSDRVRQADALVERLGPLLDLPVIVGGDLNARRGVDDRTVAAVGRVVPLESCGTGRTSRWPLRLDLLLFFLVGRHDFMFSTLGSDVPRSCQTLPDSYDSDHLPLLLEIEMR